MSTGEDMKRQMGETGASVSVSAKKPLSWANAIKQKKFSNQNTEKDDVSHKAEESSGLENQAETKMDISLQTIDEEIDIESPPLVEKLWGFQEPLPILSFLLTIDPGLALPSTLNPGAKIFHGKGLMNHGNTCFMNSVLQSLFYCRYFVCMLRVIAKNYTIGQLKGSPMLESCLNLLDYFEREPREKGGAILGVRRGAPRQSKKKQVNRQTSKGDDSISVVVDQSVKIENSIGAVQEDLTEAFLKKLKGFHQTDGTQEDAQEFLCYLIEALNEEMIANKPSFLTAGESGSDGEHSTPDEWHEAGRSKREISTARTLFSHESPLSRLFCGTFKSTLRKEQQKETTVSKRKDARKNNAHCKTIEDKNHASKSAPASITYQPFRSLPLDLDLAQVSTIDDAVRHVCEEESIQMLTANQAAPVWFIKQNLFHQMPLILVLHLKRFVYRHNTIQKLEKHVPYPMILDIPSDLQSHSGAKDIAYRLVAVIDHHGKDVDDGHYTSYVYHSQKDTWLYMDDEDVCVVKPEEILGPRKFQVPYLLFYERIQ